MSSLARKLQEQQSLEKQHVAQPDRRRGQQNKVTPGEKLIWVIFAAMLCLGGIQIISAQSEIYKVNKDIQEMKGTITEQEKNNVDLEAQVKELSTYERIYEKARALGLELDENKVKVVH